MNWDWEFTRSILPEILRGLVVTLGAVFFGMLVALIVGLVWAIARRSSQRWIAWPAHAFVEFGRSTPLLVQLFLLYYVLADFGFSPLLTGILVLGLHYSCYTAEVYRAGINGVSSGQWEAAKALNLTRWQTYRQVVLPQAIPPVIPPLGNYLIAMLKDAPLLSAITVLGMLARAKHIGNESFRYLEPLTVVGVIFLLLSITAGLAVSRIDRYLKVKRA